MKHEMNEPLAAALKRRLVNEGKRLKSTVVPTKWKPLDADLLASAEAERQWSKR